ncbi:MAG TPA: MFS transporter [Bryobacteraceae bacterium]|nr:MFS transporter [Bryobacteraceae bacterium]
MGVAKPAAVSEHGKVRWLRWYICGLLFLASTINYIDRQVLGILKPLLERELGWTETQYGEIVMAFQAAYAAMMPIAGRLLDWLGIRAGYALAVVVWSIAGMVTSLANTAMQFQIARFCLGLGEAANFPASIKAVADWFPRRQRALATGIFNSGTNIGAVVAPIIVPWITVHYGWREAFIFTGAIGFVWVAAWIWFYRQPERHGRLAASELAVIRSDSEQEPDEKIPYTRLLLTRQAWAFLLGKFLTDPVWWFYLGWLPGFLNRTYGVDLTQLGPPLIAVYLSADVGSVLGGWISSALLARGVDVNRARKTAMFICASAVIAAMFVPQAGGNMWLAITLVSIAASAHQGWSANLFTLTSDLFPKRAVGSVVGLGGMGGAVGGMLAAGAVGLWLDFSNRAYGPLFIMAGSMYLIALLVIHLLVPRMEPAKV